MLVTFLPAYHKSSLQSYENILLDGVNLRINSLKPSSIHTGRMPPCENLVMLNGDKVPGFPEIVTVIGLYFAHNCSRNERRDLRTKKIC